MLTTCLHSEEHNLLHWPSVYVYVEASKNQVLNTHILSIEFAMISQTPAGIQTEKVEN